MSSALNDSPAILFVNSGVQLISFQLPPNQQYSIDQVGSGWQHCRCKTPSSNVDEPIVQYGYVQWRVVDRKLYLAVDTSIAASEEGPPQYVAKASTLTSDVNVELAGLLDARGEPFVGLPALQFIVRPASADAGEDRLVHLVIDFGNSRTGGLLVEFRGDVPQEPMMTPLRLVNRVHLDVWDDDGSWDTSGATWWFSSRTHWCTTPYLPPPGIDVVEYRDTEKSRVFGSKVNRVPVTVQKTPHTFEEFSQVRMGREADDLVGSIEVEGDIRTGVSSPKRYLWAHDSSWLEGANWHMADPFERHSSGDRNNGHRHVSKLSGPLLRFIAPDDEAESASQGFEESPHAPRHAPRVMMQAALYELLCQAFTFVNSPVYQQMTGDAGRRRILETLTLTYPSGMITSEREQLQRQAEKAITIFSQSIGHGQVPQLKLSIDEASAVHLTYLWSESRKLGSKPSLWFSVMGRRQPPPPAPKTTLKSDSPPSESSPGPSLFAAKPVRPSQPIRAARSEASPDPPSPEARIACIDIGGGTSDLMIASYRCKSNPGGDQILGETLHRDGVSRAGDHLVKRLLERIIVPHFCETMGIETKHMNFLFGAGGPSTRRIRRQRIHWMNRLFVPLAHAYLDAAVLAADAAQPSLAGDAMISHLDPNIVSPDVVQSIQDTINKEWGSGAYDVKRPLNLWYGRIEFERIVDEVFGELMFDFCESIVEYGTDVVLLAGLPSKLPFIRELVETFLPLAKSRIVPMHGWYAGTWYPYQNPDNNNPGVIIDPKSTVVVGAAIEFCARHGKLPQFNFEMSDHTAKSSYYWGAMTESRIDAEKLIFAPQVGNATHAVKKEIRVTSENLILGRKRRERNDAQASPVYRLHAQRGRTLGKIDFSVTFQRQRDHCGEEELIVIAVEGTVDNEPAVLGENVLFDWRTLADERYYLDTGGLDRIEL